MPDRRSFLSLTSGALLGLALPGFRDAVAQTNNARISPQFFGMHMVWPVRQPYVQNFPSIPIGAWRAYLPETHWFSLEPRRGEWHFGKMDVAMRLMEARRVEVTYTLGHPPSWASSRPEEKGTYVPGEYAAPKRLADWENYIRTVARRYRSRIHCYDLWNEPKITEVDGARARFNAAQLVELGQMAYRVIKEEDPSAKLTTPSFDGGMSGVERMDAYLAAGGRHCADVIAFHFYGLPDQIVEIQAGLHRVMVRHGLSRLPVWNTESGYLIEDPTRPNNTHPISSGAFARVLAETEAAAWLGRSLAIAAAVGISRFFWFMWDGANMGLTTWVGHRVNAAGVAYGTMARWLTGMQVGPLRVRGNLVTCSLTAPRGDVSILAWTRDYKRMKWSLPPEWKGCRVEFLDETSLNAAGRASVELSAAPARFSFC